MTRLSQTSLPLWKRLLMGGGFALFLLIGLEFGIRFIYGPPPPPVLVSTGLQDHDQYLVEEDGMITAVYQAAAPTSPFPKAFDGVRLMFLGGSVVHMQQFKGQTSKEFANVTGRLLGVSSVNLGAPAMDSFDLVRIVEELEGVDHTHMVVYTGHNDFGNAYFQERFSGLSGGIFARMRRLLEHSQTYCRLRRSLSKVPKARFGEWDREGFTPQRRKATLNYLRSNLERLQWLAKKRNVQMVIATPTTSLLRRPINDVCLGKQCSYDLWQQGKAMGRADPVISAKKMRTAHDMDWNSLRAPTIAVNMIRDFAKNNSIPLIDVEASLPREPGLNVPQNRLFMDLVHFDQNGHQVVGELMAEEFKRQGLIP